MLWKFNIVKALTVNYATKTIQNKTLSLACIWTWDHQGLQYLKQMTHQCATKLKGQTLKAPPLISRTYISRATILDPTEGCLHVLKYVRKSFKTSKKVDNALCPTKMVHNDAPRTQKLVKILFFICFPPLLFISNLFQFRFDKCSH